MLLRYVGAAVERCAQKDENVANPRARRPAALLLLDPACIQFLSGRNVPSHESANAKDAEHCRAELTPYKVPRSVEFVEALPKSPIGKVLRRAVKAQYGEPDQAAGPALPSESQASRATGA